ncbi:MAG: hypothetical protein A2Z75_08895 [Chloroflexi bacterium RBG_13_50_10]|nr:MAG: hypothetical protein A2Z75_08895 [Chloroflexi bacterium RBG_13_50_10]
MPKSKNNWKSTFKEVLIPVLSTIVALAGIASGVFMQQSTNRSQIEMQKYEVTFTNNQKSYAEFMTYLQLTFKSALEKDKDNNLTHNFEQLTYNYYFMEPFLNEDSRLTTFDEINNFRDYCFNTKADENINIFDGIVTQYEAQNLDIYRDYERKFRDTLCEQLFGMTPSPE